LDGMSCTGRTYPQSGRQRAFFYGALLCNGDRFSPRLWAGHSNVVTF
jgi:hypothetical protein